MKWIIFCVALSFGALFIVPQVAGWENKLFHRNTDLTTIEYDIFNSINEKREAEYSELAPLTWDQGLYTKAKEHSQWMINTGIFTHSAGAENENVFKGEDIIISQIANSCVDKWMLSSGHRRTLLKPEITRAAVAIAINEDGTTVFATFLAK